MTVKNLWAYRRQNGFIFVEMILTAALSFFALDNIIVITHDTYFSQAGGEFEKDHLLVGEVKNTDSGISFSRDSVYASIYALRDQVRRLPEVQSVSLENDIFGGRYQSGYWDSVRTETDTTCLIAYTHSFIRGERFFETLGLKSVQGSPSVEELSQAKEEYGIVISRNLAQALFGTEKAVGRRIVYGGKLTQEENKKHLTVCGVVEDVKAVESQRYFYSIYYPTDLWDNSPSMLIRLKPDADAKAFLARYNIPDMRLREGTYQLVETDTYMGYKESHSLTSESEAISTLFGLFLSILLLNVALGTLGTYWLQIRKRTGDIGILRSFGAQRKSIFRMIWKEAALLTFIACVIGQVIWLQIALNIGLYQGKHMPLNGRETDWVTQFWPHFLIICVIQYILMLVIVTLGIIIPSLIAMYKKPVNALRYE